MRIESVRSGDSSYENMLREDLAGERQECMLILPYVHQTKLMNFLKELGLVKLRYVYQRRL